MIHGIGKFYWVKKPNFIWMLQSTLATAIFGIEQIHVAATDCFAFVEDYRMMKFYCFFCHRSLFIYLFEEIRPCWSIWWILPICLKFCYPKIAPKWIRKFHHFYPRWCTTSHWMSGAALLATFIFSDGRVISWEFPMSLSPMSPNHYPKDIWF